MTFRDITQKHYFHRSPLPKGTIVRIVQNGATFSSYAKKFKSLGFSKDKEYHDHFPNGAEGYVVTHTTHDTNPQRYGYIYHIKSKDGKNECLISGNGFIVIGHTSTPSGKIWRDSKESVNLTIHIDARPQVFDQLPVNTDAWKFIHCSEHPSYDPSDDIVLGCIAGDGGGFILSRGWYGFLESVIKPAANHDDWSAFAKQMHASGKPLTNLTQIPVSSDITHMLLFTTFAMHNTRAFDARGNHITEEAYIRKTVDEDTINERVKHAQIV